MSGVARAWAEWLEDRFPDGPDGAHWHQDDVQEAFEAGWEAAMGAEWVSSAVPMLGIEGGERLGPAHPGAPR